MTTESPAGKTGDETPRLSEGWYRDEVAELSHKLPKIEGGLAEFLAASRKDMHDALDKFFARVQHFVGIYIAIFTLVVGISYFWLKDAKQADALPLAGAALCLLAGFFGMLVARPGMAALYELYVASVIYASQLHDAVGIGTHRWFEYVRDYSEADESSNKERLIEKWMNDKEGNSNYTSSRHLILCFEIVSFVASACLFVAWIWRFFC